MRPWWGRWSDRHDAVALVVEGPAAIFTVAFYSLGGQIHDARRRRRRHVCELALLGPQEAVIGTLAIGWSTAAIVTAVHPAHRYRHRPKSVRNVTPTDECSGWFATLRKKFASWITGSNRNGYFGLARTLPYALRRGLALREHPRTMARVVRARGGPR
jgi:hypothetical protein